MRKTQAGGVFPVTEPPVDVFQTFSSDNSLLVLEGFSWYVSTQTNWTQTCISSQVCIMVSAASKQIWKRQEKNRKNKPAAVKPV